MTTPRIQERALEVCAELGHPIEVLSPFERSLCIAVEERLIALERALVPDWASLEMRVVDAPVTGIVHIDGPSPTGRDPSPPPEPQNIRPTPAARSHHPKCKLDPNHRGNCRT